VNVRPQQGGARWRAIPTRRDASSTWLRRLASVLLIGALAHAAESAPAAAAAQDLSDPALAFIARLPAYAAPSPAEKVTGAIRLWGHGSFRRDFMGRLVRRWAGEFRAHHPAAHIENQMFGTASAIGALYTGAGDIALLGEEISPAAAAAFRRAKGYAPTEIQVATGSLDVNFFDYAHMVFVHRDNPIAGLTVAQLDAIFGAEHRRGPRNVRTWGEAGLGGEWTARRIQPHSWKVDEDFALFYRERVLEHSHRWNADVREYVHVPRADGTEYDHGQQIIDAIARDRAAIGISNVRYAVPGVRALPLAWQDGGPFIAPTAETLIAQTYPLVRIIPAFVDRAPGRPLPPQVREFLLYVLSREGQRALVEETAYLPIGERVNVAQREKLR
jgi:phosphate transport system substrate-binding protein